MKQVKLLMSVAAISLATATTHATIYVVNNSAANPGQFYYLQAAIDSADTGDTLMIQPSNNSYGDVLLNKSLTLIGVGHKPVKDLPLIANIGTITFGADIGAGATIIGLKIYSLNTSCPPNGVWYATNNLTVRNCDLNFIGTNYGNNGCYGYNVYNDCVVENCVIRGMGFPYGNNVLVQNNIIYAFAISFSPNMTNVTVKNNLFIYESGNWGILTANAVVFENNIFFRFGPTSNGVTNCIYNNNLTYQTNNDALVGGTNTGSDNVVGQDPLFVNLSYSANPIYQPSPYNYRLQELSPGHLAGTDGQDIGPYGNNMTFSETGESDAQPVIRVMNLLNSTLPSSGTINVHVKATASKND